MVGTPRCGVRASPGWGQWGNERRNGQNGTDIDILLRDGTKRSAVPRQIRIEYEGAIYHVMSRGDHRENIVRGNYDRAGLVRKHQPLSEFPWSSYPDYLRPKSQRPKWLRTDRLLGEHGLGRDDRRSRLEFTRRMEAARYGANEPVASNALMRGGWWGSRAVSHFAR